MRLEDVMRTCTVKGCDRKHEALGYCRMHYVRYKRTGKVTRKTILERFQEKYIAVPESGCLLWEGCFTSDGYGQLKVKGKMMKAHRVSWELHKGPIPGGLQVCHKCDTPACVNPDHMFIGSDKDNTQDAIKKGRFSGFKPGNIPWNKPKALARAIEEAQ